MPGYCRTSCAEIVRILDRNILNRNVLDRSSVSRRGHHFIVARFDADVQAVDKRPLAI